MSDRVVIPVPGLGVLALDPETYRAALVEAEQLATMLAIPVTWLEQAAREGRIPSLQFGRRRRFRRADVEAAGRRSDGQS